LVSRPGIVNSVNIVNSIIVNSVFDCIRTVVAAAATAKIGFLILQYLVDYSKYSDEPYNVPWLVTVKGQKYVSADTIRTLQAAIGEIVGATKKERGAAAAAKFPVKLF
jgi:hypothetical protein